jgi:hypothetical protein
MYSLTRSQKALLLTCLPVLCFGGYFGFSNMSVWRQVAANVPFLRDQEEAVHQQQAADALKQCDVLAAHPHDSGRYSAGVADDQLAAGAAVEACEPAVKLNPGQARAWFELGRAYWGAQRDREGFNAFVESAKRGFSPAKKYLGDAYLQGRGLPPGRKQDAYEAMTWYKESCGKRCDPSAADVGFVDAEKALTETEGYLKRNTFDKTAFQNPAFMEALYNGNFRGVDSKSFLAYVSGLVEEIGGDKILYVDSSCKPLSTIATSGLTSLEAVLGVFLNPGSDPLSEIVHGIIGFVIFTDQGRRDAVTLVNRYGCKSTIAQRIMNNIVIKPGASGTAITEVGRIGAPPLTPSGTERVTQSPSFQDGMMAWNQWDSWFNSQTGDAHDGALFWATARSKSYASCSDGQRQMSAEFRNGCNGARAILTPMDVRRINERDFRKGWNYHLLPTNVATEGRIPQ